MPEATDLVYNALQLGLDAALVVYAARSKRFSRAILALPAAAVSAVLLALWLSTAWFELTRLLAFAVFAHAPLLLGAIGWVRRREAPRSSVACGLGALVIVGVAVDAFLIEPYWLEVSHVRLETDKLTSSVRIAVLADFQTDRIGGYEERVLRRVMQAEPDLVLMPGDYLHTSNRERYARLVEELRDLFERTGFDAPLGIYAVRGNVEHQGWPHIFDGTRVRPLSETSSLKTGELLLTGLDLSDSFDPSLVVPPADRFHLLFGHAPDFALGRIDADLLVAGHTHGGQVRIPFWGPVITLSRVPRAWAAGVTSLPGGQTLVVSRGVGMERGPAPPMRFWCRPEIVIIDVEGTGLKSVPGPAE